MLALIGSTQTDRTEAPPTTPAAADPDCGDGGRAAATTCLG